MSKTALPEALALTPPINTPPSNLLSEKRR